MILWKNAMTDSVRLYIIRGRSSIGPQGAWASPPSPFSPETVAHWDYKLVEKKKGYRYTLAENSII